MNNALISSYTEAGFFGKLIILILLGFSIYAWALVQKKLFFFKKIKKQDNHFKDLIENYRGNIINIEIDDETLIKDSPLYDIFQKSTESLKTIIMNKNKIENEDIETIEIIIEKTISEQKTKMESSNFALATIAAISPLLGLLGTVWGIMQSFREMGMAGTASISTVAPGISEALVTTVAGLIVAIPAVVIYNYTVSKIKEELTTMRNFGLEILSRIEKLKYLQDE